LRKVGTDFEIPHYPAIQGLNPRLSSSEQSGILATGLVEGEVEELDSLSSWYF